MFCVKVSRQVTRDFRFFRSRNTLRRLRPLPFDVFMGNLNGECSSVGRALDCGSSVNTVFKSKMLNEKPNGLRVCDFGSVLDLN
jgi:hypothetical protein